jgi:hypothetical protein
MYWAEYKGVYFVEGDVAGSRALAPIDTKHDGAWSQSQLKSLDTLKDAMATRVKQAGCNAVINFRYGQKNTFWRSLLSIDDVWWHASGTIAQIDPTRLPARG